MQVDLKSECFTPESRYFTFINIRWWCDLQKHIVKHCSIVEIVMWIFVFHLTEIALLNGTVQKVLEWGLG
jgi:hypothetical protein